MKTGTVVVGLATSPAEVERIVRDLIDNGFNRNDISVLMPSSGNNFALEAHSKAPEGAVAGATAGGVIGGAIGLLAGLGALVIPGLGPLLAVGPLFAALSGVAAGGTVGGVAGSLIGLGVPEVEAKQYEAHVRKGSALVSVNVASPDQNLRAASILKRDGARQISSMTEARA